ncbi:MAG: hypothetical protein JW946_01595 [Candidatus Omnitrophica bacterium]|nr:hypothetical protein [Candidatus Omnitrophota bacterium]
MSIIHDALRKAAALKKENQSENVVRVEADALNTPCTSDASAGKNENVSGSGAIKKKHARGAFKVFLILLIISAAMLPVYNYFLPLFSSSEVAAPKPQVNSILKSIEPKKVIESANTLAGNIISGVQNEIKKPKDAFVLSGIVYSQDDPIAVINNSIYTIGGNVDGAKVIEINEKSVMLEKDGKDLELKLK